MKIGGHGLGEHIRLLAPLFGLIGAVYALRLVLSASGAPPVLTRICSVTAILAVSVLLAALLIHFKNFGSYPNLAVATVLLVFWEQILIAAAIAFSTFTGKQNIYAAPEYSPGHLAHGPWGHVVGHLTFGIGIGTLMGTVTGSLLLWLLRRLVPAKSRQ